MPDRMGVTSLYTFKNVTSTTKNKSLIRKLKASFSTRGPQIKIIDSALAEWEEAIRHDAKYPKVKALLHVIVACSWWLKLKTGKSSSTTASRKQAIEKLRGEAQTALNRLDTAGGYYANKRSNAIQSGLVVGNKSGNNKLDFSGTQSIGLHGKYSYERQQYLACDKQFAIAAGAIKERYDVILKKDFNAITLEDFCTEFNNLSPHTKNLSRVDYFTRSERLDFLVMVHGNQFLKPNNEPYKTRNEILGIDKKRCSDMWAMDQYGNLYISKTSGRNENNFFFNHSSFLAGNEVICAGMITIHEGELAFISNASGHYKPDRYAFQNALRILSEEVDLSQVRADVLTDNGPQKFKAETLLHNPGAQPNWPVNWNLLHNLTADM